MAHDLKSIPTPAGICNACLQNPGNTFLHHSGTVLVSYCDHSRSAGFAHLGPGKPFWTLYTPFEREAWFDTVNGAALEALNCAKPACN